MCRTTVFELIHHNGIKKDGLSERYRRKEEKDLDDTIMESGLSSTKEFISPLDYSKSVKRNQWIAGLS
ncbi:unnamed protein product, partial [Notodromas monacha]